MLRRTVLEQKPLARRVLQCPSQQTCSFAVPALYPWRSSSTAAAAAAAVPVHEIAAVSPITTTVYSSISSSTTSNSLMDYARGWAWQQTLLSRRLELRRRRQQQQDGEFAPATQDDDNDCILLLEHHPVYTLGRGADENHVTFLKDKPELKQRLCRKSRGNRHSARLQMDKPIIISNNVHQEVATLASKATPVLAPNGAPIYRIDRGGEVTFHGPGQLVVYPLLDLKRLPYQQDLHWYLRNLEQVVMDVLQHYDIKSSRDKDNTGVWVKDKKICAVGVSSSRWITTHGFALNVHCDLTCFDTSVILPCGIEEKGVTTMQQVLSEQGSVKIPTLDEVAEVVLQKMQNVFGIETIQYGKIIS